MDDAERIPINIGYEIAAASLEQADQSTSVLEDGTVVINILAAQPCSPAPSTDEEIVVCASAPEGGALRPLPRPETPSPMDVLAEALSAKLGPVEIGSIDRGDSIRTLGARIRF